MSFNTNTTSPVSDVISTATSAATYRCHACNASFSLAPDSCPHCHCTIIDERSPYPNPSSDADMNCMLRLIQHIAAPESDAIPTVSITSSMLSSDGGIMCAVCKDEFLVGVEAKKLPCSHLYHVDCIEPWLQERNSCPVCRCVVPSGEEGAMAMAMAIQRDWGLLQEGEVRSDMREMVRRYLNYVAAIKTTKTSSSQIAEDGSGVSGPANSGETVTSRFDDDGDSARSRHRGSY